MCKEEEIISLRSSDVGCYKKEKKGQVEEYDLTSANLCEGQKFQFN
jgi:hypothetical protein